MPAIPYATAVGPGVVAETGASFAAEVARVLADPRGWRKYGYEFIPAPAGPETLLIRLETSAAADALCGARGFSCQRPSYNDIVLHEGNWLGGSASSLSVERYRSYVISHELGHYLGLKHPARACPIDECRRRGLRECPASVMNQNTRGPGRIAPCVESEWPLDPDWGIDDPRPAASRPIAAHASRLMLAVVVLILVGIAAILQRCGAMLFAPVASRHHGAPAAWQTHSSGG